ncbi:MAG: hypothetical protein Q9165_007354 [Trypethelium subeluteriae]
MLVFPPVYIFIVSETVKALGSIEVLNNITSFSYEALTIYRSQTLTQNYNLQHSDQSVSAAGSQIMSFKEGNNTLYERIDRAYRYNDYWIWAWPELVPEMNYSMVLRDGLHGFACFNQGQNSFYADDPTQALGYADAYLTDYLVYQAHQFAILWLVKQFVASPSVTAHHLEDPLTGAVLPAIDHPKLGLTLVINNSLPYMVRSYEQHKIFGKSTSDVIFSNYSMFGSVLFPQRFQTVYNTVNMVEDFFADNIIINPTWSADYFEPKSKTNRTAPAQSPEHPRSEAHEFFESALWDGPFTFNVSDVVVEYPVPGLLVEFDEGFLITDASPFRSQILLDWVRKNSRKNITHVVPSHHHRDHAGGVGDYVAAGAKLVVPEIARDYYKNVNGGQVEFVTYTREQPFVLDDGNVQFRSFWREENPHAADWSYGIATSSCPKNDTGVVVYVADVVDPGSVPAYSTSNALRWDAGYARQFILNAAQDGVPRSSLIIGAHGSTIEFVHNSESLENVANITGVVYPDIAVKSLAGNPNCY